MKYIIVLSLFFTLMISLFSCTGEGGNGNNEDVVKVDTLKLDVGFPSSMSSFEYKGQVFFYCYDLISYKKLKVYNEKFKLLRSYSLENIAGYQKEFAALEMITPDSALLMSDVTTNMVIGINFKTKKFQQAFLNKIVNLDKHEEILEYRPNRSGNFLFQNKVVLSMSPSIQTLTIKFPNMDFTSYLQIFDSLYFELPQYVVISHPFDSIPKVSFLKKSKKYIEDFKNAKHESINATYFGNNEMIYSNHYTNYLNTYRFDGSISKRVIQSKFTDISVPKRTWNEIKNNPVALDNMSTDLQHSGRVVRIFFNKKKSQYNIFLVHSKKRKPKLKSKVSPFIWQVYDKDFNLLSEKEMSPTELMVGTLVTSKKHVYFTYYNEKTYDPNIKVLVRFSL